MVKNKGLVWGIYKIWGETPAVNLFIDDSSLDSDEDIIMHFCDSKGYWFFYF